MPAFGAAAAGLDPPSGTAFRASRQEWDSARAQWLSIIQPTTSWRQNSQRYWFTRGAICRTAFYQNGRMLVRLPIRFSDAADAIACVGRFVVKIRGITPI
jgi:hypothetical protein